MRKIIVILCCFTLLSCVRDERAVSSPPPVEHSQNTVNIDRFMRHGPQFPIGESLEEIVKNLGKPLKQTMEDKRNIHNKNQIDIIYKLFFGGLYLEVYHVTEMNKDLVILLEVTSDRYPLLYGLGVGAAKDKVRSVLGRPNDEKPSLWRYFASDLIMGAFEFSFQGDRVVSVKWYYGID